MERRTLLAGLAVIGAAPVVVAQTQKSFAATAGSMADFTAVKTADQFYASVLPRAELSLATSQVAVETAVQKNALEFAGFELGEAITVNMVLKDIGAKVDAPDSAAMEMAEKVKSAEKGNAFDQAYIALQLQNHEYLRDLADAYLHNSVAMTDPDARQGRHLATLMLAVFKEHVAICKRISGELGA